MDPNATLAALVGAALNGDHEQVRDFADYLAEWIAKGGFLPTAAECSRVNAMVGDPERPR